jgi:hypothetical protein
MDMPYHRVTTCGLIDKDGRTIYCNFLFRSMRASDAVADELIGSFNDVADKQRDTGCQ